MNLYIKNGDNFIQVKEIENVAQGCDCLIFKMDKIMRTEDMRSMEYDLSFKLKKTCVVLDARLEKVYGIKNG